MVQKAIDLTLELGGTYYLPYQPFATKKQFKKSYPTAKVVYKKNLKLILNKLFSSGFSSRYLAPSKEHNHYKAI